MIDINLQTPAPLITDEGAKSSRFSGSGIGKINHVFDADIATHRQVYPRDETEGKLVELLLEILTIPVGLATAEQAIQ